MFSAPIDPRKAANLLRIATKVLVGIGLLIALRGFFALFDGFASLNPFASGTFTFWDNLVQAWGTSIQTTIAALIAWCGSVYFDHVASVAERAGAANRYNAVPEEMPPSIDPYAPPVAAAPAAIAGGAAAVASQVPGAGGLSKPGLFGPLVAGEAARSQDDRAPAPAAAPPADSLAAVPAPLTVERPPAVEVRPQPEERAPVHARQERDDEPAEPRRRRRPAEDADRDGDGGRDAGRSRSDRDGRDRGPSERKRRPADDRERSRSGSSGGDGRRSRSGSSGDRDRDRDRPSRSGSSSGGDRRQRRPAERDERPARRPPAESRRRSSGRADGPADRPRRSSRDGAERPRRRPSNDT